MTDNEMIELLLNDVAALHSYFLCFDKENKSHMIRTMDICDLIIRLKTEIERLKKGWRADVIETAEIKAEAVKSFAERLKEKADANEIWIGGKAYTFYMIREDKLDNLANKIEK